MRNNLTGSHFWGRVSLVWGCAFIGSFSHKALVDQQ